jgi:hypothetical protein
LAVFRAAPDSPQGSPVPGRAIPHVPLETVGRIAGREPPHQPIASHFGNDRGRRDRQDLLIAPGDGPLGKVDLREAQVVDQQVARGRAQATDGPGHRQTGRGEHADPVELGRRAPAEADRHRHPPDRGLPVLAGGRGELLRVPHPLQDPGQIEPVERQDHGRCDHRAGQRPPTHFVDPCDPFMPEGAQLEFVGEVGERAGRAVLYFSMAGTEACGPVSRG